MPYASLNNSESETRSECYTRMSRETGSKILAQLYRREAARWAAQGE